MITNLCDVHTHTVASLHAYSTIEENVRAAAAAGLELLGTTDHFSAMISPGVALDGTGADVRDYQAFLNTIVWPREWMGVTLLRGAEVDIVDVEGHLFGHGVPAPCKITGDPYPVELDLENRILGDLDYAIASVHMPSFTYAATRAQNTRMYVEALQNPKVLILGHIGRMRIDFEYDPVIEAARDLGKLIEINSSTPETGEPARERCLAIARRCAELGCGVSLGTDAHISCQVANFGAAAQLLDEVHFPEELVATRTKSAFLEALRAAKVPPAARKPL